MGLFNILGDMAELPFRIAQVPTKVVKAIDEATIDSGAGELMDDVNESTLGDAGRAINRGISSMDD